MTTTVRDGEGWLQGAACAGKASERWLTAKPSEAVEICRGCPVRIECLHDALADKTLSGIWGGLTAAERRTLPVLPSGKAEALEVLRNLLDAAGTVKTAAAQVRPRARKAPRPATTPPRKKRKKKASSPAKAAPQPKASSALVRKDVAELLRAGATQAQITAQLRVSTRVVTATRQAYGIPYPRRSGYRYTPEQRAENERRALSLLRAGATHAEVTKQVGISAPTTVRIRKKAGLPASKNHGGPPARTKAEGLAANVEPYGDGHARWTGPMSGRMPTLFAERTRFNARHVIFEQQHGRPPVGYVRTGCEEAGCIAGAHLVDDDTARITPPEEPVTVQALQDLLTEIDHQGGPRAARDNRLNLTSSEPTMPTTELVQTSTSIARGTANALPLASLLKWGDSHPDPAVQEQAAQARAAVEGLRTRHAADQELTAIATEAEQLEKKLAELRARQAELAPKRKGKRKPSSVVRDYDTRTVRAWAAEAGVDCPGVGQIPKRVLEAWRAANTTTSADA